MKYRIKFATVMIAFFYFLKRSSVLLGGNVIIALD